MVRMGLKNKAHVTQIDPYGDLGKYMLFPESKVFR